VEAFDTASECKVAEHKLENHATYLWNSNTGKKLSEDVRKRLLWKIGQESDAECIATDDPRLK
jgi:hypothetical protein